MTGRRKRRCSVELLVGVILFAHVAVAGGQATSQALTSPTSGTLAGVVRDTGGRALAGAEVSIPELNKGVKADSSGAFVLADVLPGTHEVWVRRLGFIVVQFPWDARAGARLEVAIKMRILPRTLDPVVVYASEERTMKSRSVVHGFVVDADGRPIEGADVALLGAGRTTKTANDGSFIFRHAPEGVLTVRAREIGYAPAVSRFQLLANDDRAVYLRLDGKAQQLDAVNVTADEPYDPAEGAWRDLDQRTRWRNAGGSSLVLGPERLAKFGKSSLNVALREVTGLSPRGSTNIIAGAASSASRNLVPSGDVCVLENGYRAMTRPLSSYGANQVASVEYYPATPPETELTGTVAAFMNRIPGCEETAAGKHPAWYVIWLTDAH